MSRLDDLIAARDAWQAKLNTAASDATAAGGKPNNPSGIDHDKWLSQCRSMVDWYNQQIALEDGPQEEIARGYST